MCATRIVYIVLARSRRVCGVILRFIQNNVDLTLTPWNGFNQDYRSSEFAGACYSPDGKLYLAPLRGIFSRRRGKSRSDDRRAAAFARRFR